jgi:hypothetical protein
LIFGSGARRHPVTGGPVAPSEATIRRTVKDIDADEGQVLRHRSQLATSIYAKVDDTALRVLTRRWPGGAL